ncbi:uncharacterized protein LOC141612675 [Silene latifolia]|uniref:uncharacterized protein LOC141612675 n=1 Tax=Silene latifolia TaxID=37657 RepID=UPI003D770EE6
MWDGLLHRNTFRGKCKTALSRTKTRLEVIKKKRIAMQKFLKKDIADLLKNNLDRNAYGRAEGLYNELNLTSCYDYVEQCCACVSEHLKQMHKERECPEECRVAVSSLVYAAARFADLPELRDLRNQFNEKYGKLLEPFVSKEFVEKLKPKPPTMEMKLQLMQEIAQEFSIIWDSLPLQQQLHNQGIDKPTNLGPGVAAIERMCRSRSTISQVKSKQEDGSSLMNEDQTNNPKTRRHNSFSESKKTVPGMLQDEKRQSCLRNESENNPCRKPFTNKIVSAPYVIKSDERKSDTAPEDISSKNKEDNDLLSKAAKPRPKSVRTKFLNKSISSATSNSEHGTGIAEREIRSARVPQARTGNVFSDEEDETDTDRDISGSFGRNMMSFSRSPEIPGTPKSTLPPPPGQRRYLFADSQTDSPGRDSDGQTSSDTPSSSGRSKFLPPDYPQPDSPPTETDISPSMRHVKSDSLISDNAGVIKHVHPKMPSFDELAERVAALRKI